MFNHHGDLAHQLILKDDISREADTGIEIQVMEWQRTLKHVPHRLLRVEQVQIGVPWQYTLGEALLETDLELDIAVILGGFAAQHCSAHEIDVLKQAEVRTVVHFLTDAVGNLLAGFLGVYNLPIHRDIQPSKHSYGYQ